MVRNPRGAPPPVEPTPTPAPEPPKEERPVVNDDLPEYGDISEIRRMRKVFVIAAAIDSQNLLIRELQKYDGIQVVGSPDNAQVFVAFGQGSAATGLNCAGSSLERLTITRKRNSLCSTTLKVEGAELSGGKPRIFRPHPELLLAVPTR